MTDLQSVALATWLRRLTRGRNLVVTEKWVKVAHEDGNGIAICILKIANCKMRDDGGQSVDTELDHSQKVRFMPRDFNSESLSHDPIHRSEERRVGKECSSSC